jgi:hypothetical protein
MDKAIKIIEDKIEELEKYKNISSFATRILILKDVLRDLKK